MRYCHLPHLVYPGFVPTVTCKVSDKLAARLNTAAREQRRPKSALMREAFEERFEGRRGRGPVKAIDLVRHLRGCLKGGPSRSLRMVS